MIHDKGPINYDGTLLKQKFGYDFYQDKYNPNGIIVIAYGPMSIGYDGTFFLNDYSSFDDAIHICWEIPNLNLRGNSFFKQIFSSKIYEELKALNNIEDLFLTDDYNISIKNVLSLNLNKVTDVGTVLGYIGLDNSVLNLLEKDKEDFSKKIEKHFYNLMQLSFIDSIKTT